MRNNYYVLFIKYENFNIYKNYGLESKIIVFESIMYQNKRKELYLVNYVVF